VLFVREVVRVNHLANCLLCHPRSSVDNDLLVGTIPSPDEPLPSGLTSRYGSRGGIGSIRADVTYFRQDFSVGQPVANPGHWPKVQRYDYLIRERQLTPAELAGLRRRKESIKPPPLGENKEAVLFALRELTGKDAGLSARQWRKVLAKGDLKNRPKR
jgi:hypothetical protein